MQVSVAVISFETPHDTGSKLNCSSFQMTSVARSSQHHSTTRSAAARLHMILFKCALDWCWLDGVNFFVPFPPTVIRPAGQYSSNPPLWWREHALWHGEAAIAFVQQEIRSDHIACTLVFILSASGLFALLIQYTLSKACCNRKLASCLPECRLHQRSMESLKKKVSWKCSKYILNIDFIVSFDATFSIFLGLLSIPTTFSADKNMKMIRSCLNYQVSNYSEPKCM